MCLTTGSQNSWKFVNQLSQANTSQLQHTTDCTGCVLETRPFRKAMCLPRPRTRETSPQAIPFPSYIPPHEELCDTVSVSVIFFTPLAFASSPQIFSFAWPNLIPLLQREENGFCCMKQGIWEFASGPIFIHHTEVSRWSQGQNSYIYQ